jgi:hypothetical protein
MATLLIYRLKDRHTEYYILANELNKPNVPIKYCPKI